MTDRSYCPGGRGSLTSTPEKARNLKDLPSRSMRRSSASVTGYGAVDRPPLQSRCVLLLHRKRLMMRVITPPQRRSLDFRAIGQYPVQVKSITYTAARENLASTINRVCEDQAPVVITRNRDQAVVMLSLAEYESLQETAYLLRSPANARRLLAAVDTLKRGKGLKRKIKLGA